MEPRTSLDARKNVHQAEEAKSILKESSELFVAKGKKVVHIDLKKTELSEDELVKLVLGPTGNLRAPTYRVGKKMVVGFNAEMYEQVFG